MSDRASYFVLFIPWLIIFLIFTFGFAAFNVYVSFTDWQGLYPSFNLVGFENYLALPEMTGFIEAVKNTALLFLVGMPAAVLVSIALAALIDIMGTRVASMFRSIAIVSMAIGGVMVAVFWVWMFNYTYGGINDLLRFIGLGNFSLHWLGDSDVVMFSVIIMLIWKFSGYGGLIIYGGLQAIPQSHIEEAEMNGATTFQVYLRVLIPQIKLPIITAALLLSMFMLKSFGYIWPLTGGGPGWSSTLFPVLIYRKMFEATNFAGGAAAATFMFLLVSLVAIPYLMFQKRSAE